MEEIKKEGEFGVPSIGIPAEVLFNPELTQTDKILFGLLKNLSQSSKGCWASNKYLASMLFLKKQSISNSIANLKKYKYIIVQYSKNPKDMTEEEKEQRNNQLIVKDERYIFINPSYTSIYQELVKLVHDNLHNNQDISFKLYPYIKILIGGYKKNTTKVVKEVVKESFNKLKEFSLKKAEKTSLVNNNLSIKNPFLNYSTDVKELFLYWNKLNIKNHREKESKTFIDIMKQLEQKLEKFTKDKIIESFDIYYNLIKDKNSILKNIIPGHIIGLNEFFKFNTFTIKRMIDCKSIIEKNWFYHCNKIIKDDSYRNNFIKENIIVDKYPDLTKELKELFIDYLNGNYEVKEKDDKYFIAAAKKFYEYFNKKDKIYTYNWDMGKADKNIKYLIEAIDYYASQDIEILPSWLCSKRTWEERLPEYLQEINLMYKNTGGDYWDMSRNT